MICPLLKMVSGPAAGSDGVDAMATITAVGTNRTGSARTRRRAGAARYRPAIVEAHRIGLEVNPVQPDALTAAIERVAASDLTRDRGVGADACGATRDLAEIQDAAAADRDAAAAAATGAG